MHGGVGGSEPRDGRLEHAASFQTRGHCGGSGARLRGRHHAARRRFAELYQALDASTATSAEVAALRGCFSQAPAADAAWAVYFLAHALQAAPETLAATLGAPAEWLVECKYDGMRAQGVKRRGRVWIWSRGEELVSDRFPKVVQQAPSWPDGTAVDGELLVWLPGSAKPAPFNRLQPRLNRKTLPRKLLAEALTALAAAHGLHLAPVVVAPDWPACARPRDGARERSVEGLMLKHRGAAYGIGRARSELAWWKWKVDALSVDAVLVYAQAGHGRRAGVYTDYTFAVWSRPPASAAKAQAVVEAIARREPTPPRDSETLQLLPFAKAYSGSSDEEFKAVDRIVRATTLEKFGPVRSVRPTRVFEIAFEGLNASPRRRSGVAVRPPMQRLRHDKPLHEAATLASAAGAGPGGLTGGRRRKRHRRAQAPIWRV
ncbi:MAG: hypothetical protein C0505_03725 [Leptothrix sp. (in: Bacteria)]|nr:hypothetical protein [Leptothrix sp. (in: b-proteobacteria)]